MLRLALIALLLCLSLDGCEGLFARGQGSEHGLDSRIKIGVPF
jgi:hypothetical protein